MVMSAAAWLRLPPAIRVAAYARARCWTDRSFSQCAIPGSVHLPVAPVRVNGQQAQRWRIHSQSCRYATVESGPTKNEAIMHDQVVPSNISASQTATEEPAMDGIRVKLVREVFDRASRVQMDESSRRTLRQKVRRLGNQQAQKAVPVLRDLIAKGFNPSSKPRASPSDVPNCASQKAKVTGSPRPFKAQEATETTASDSLLSSLQVQPTDAALAPAAGIGHVQDLDFICKTMPLPTRDQYPQAISELFRPIQAAVALHNTCAKHKIPMQTDIAYTTRGSTEPGVYHVCNLTVEFSDGFEESAMGEGRSKAAAKQAAWLHLVSKLHQDGRLSSLISGKTEARRDSVAAMTEPPDVTGHQDEEVYAITAARNIEDRHDDLEPVKISEKVLEEEKDAKVEIYNYAASFGLIPSFEVQLIERKARHGRRGLRARPARKLFRATISLPAQELRATGIGTGLRHAETAAALNFKSAAEERTSSTATRPQRWAHALNTDTAGFFFDFLRESRRRLNLGLEVESVSHHGLQHNTATVNIDGEPIGDPVTLQTKKQATEVARLTAAIKLVQDEPDLLEQFGQRLQKDGGRILKSLSPISLPIDAAVAHTMKQAMIQARAAGLPDSREALAPEDIIETDRRFRRSVSTAEMMDANFRLLEQQKQYDNDAGLADLRAQRASLPMNQRRSDVTALIADHPYSIIVGATGSGKTTQVPQIILEDAIADGNGGACNTICTQPRRIAATSVAQRVADERSETLAQSVGYHVRFDRRLPRQAGSITYCTTGILLEQMKHDSEVLNNVSHLIIDEVHERDLDIDFLMITLKKLIKSRRSEGKSIPKVVLMSATLDTELFAKYFGEADESGVVAPCPSLTVPGRTFPVKERFLGDVMFDLLQAHRSELSSILAIDRVSDEYVKAETTFSKQGDTSAASPSESSIDWRQERRTSTDSSGEPAMLSAKDETLVPTALLAATIAHICKTSTDGAILAFLPGLPEILKTQRILQERKIFGLDFSDGEAYKIHLLHSTVPKEEQAAVFQTVPRGCRKIILSTNIAETSITVSDVQYVIDVGKLRENRYDQAKRMTRLQCVWESKSNAKQRAGRAGRVQNGFYYALFSKERHDSLRAVGLPELLRTDLQETALAIKAQRFVEPIEDFLSQAIEPPPPASVRAAVSNLKMLEALTEDEKLTDLGRLLARFPLHPTLGKMVVLGVIFKCLDPLIIFGAAAEERSLFVTPMNPAARKAAKASKQRYAGGEASDHLATLNGFRELRQIEQRRGIGAAFNHGHSHDLHMGAYRAIDQSAKQILVVLKESGLIDSTPHGAITSQMYGPDTMNVNSNNTMLIKSLLLAGFHPNLAAMQPSRRAVFRVPGHQNVAFHPSSVNDTGYGPPKDGKAQHPIGTLFTYSTLAGGDEGDKISMRDATMVTPLMSVLFGGKLRMSGNNRLEMDDWLPFSVQASDRWLATKLTLEYRKALDRVLNRAFRSLADIDSRDPTSFAQDPVRDLFAQSVVRVLDEMDGGNLARDMEVPQWRRARMSG